MQHKDSDIEQMLQDIDAHEDAPSLIEQPPSVAIEPVTRFGPNAASVVPGQSDADLAAYLAAWMRAKKRELRVAALCYAGLLGSTAPKQDDYPDAAVAYQAAYSQWLDSCTDRQRHLLQIASERKAEKRRAEGRAEYAQGIMAKEGRSVREYKRGLSPEDRNERRRLQSVEKQKRYREREKMKASMSASDA